MRYYGDIINGLGATLAEYNSIGWVEFRNQMMAEIKGFRIVSPTMEWESESIVKYNMGDIFKSNIMTRNNPNFTYYTNNGPEDNLNSKPILANPEKTIKIGKSEYKVKVDENQPYNNQLHTSGEYEEKETGRVETNAILNTDNLDKTIYGGLQEYDNGKTLLSKTKRWFEDAEKDYIGKRFSTLISRFHTDTNQRSIEDLSNDIGVQAFSKQYGLSHGRNLLKETPTVSDGYDDPYCRVWKWHKQYSTYFDTIRPFRGQNGSGATQDIFEGEYNWSVFRTKQNVGFDGGGKRLEKYGVMYDDNGNTNGLVNITPSIDDSNTLSVSVKKCMFSIENLAWKGTFNNWNTFDENGLSPEQKGPLGGRIMWFPPYDIKFNESTQANWQSNEFIGRGEPIFTYANTTRSGTLSFKLLIDHPAILDYWERRRDTGSMEKSTVDDIDSKEQELLRFFAGCSILKASGYNAEEQSQNGSKLNESKLNESVETEPETENGLEKINFLVFWPNNYSGKDDKIDGEVDPIEYLMNGVGAQRATNVMVDGPKEYVTNDNIYDLPTNVKTQYYYDEEQVGGYEMNGYAGVSVIKSATTNNSICTITDSDGKITRLAKMFDNKYVINTPTPEGEDIKEWNKCRYYYRADKNTLNQRLKGEDDNGALSYIDKKSNGFNLEIKSNLCSRFNLDPQTTYSMAEIFVALKGDENVVYQQLTSLDRLQELKSILSGERGKLKYVNCYGSASSQGNNRNESVNLTRNETLAKNRAKTISKWLSSNLKGDGIQYKDMQPISGSDYDTNEAFVVDDDKSYNQEDSNAIEAKLTRFTLVEILYGGIDVKDGSETQASIDENGELENNTSVLSNQTTEAPIPDNDVSTGSYYKEVSNVRYDNEATFFEKLEANAPFMAKLLSERIRNFDPVFHSMSPEGFNARLTFLNQCMRQGPTISSSDTNNNNVSNLSFGRPPVCVLRVGDFYNTKIVINSMTIDYDPLVWDLNHEGIGVMPMIANISLNFNFIGGSDLGGPIQRLQNATSFNYYANTGVYDNRSEMIDYLDGKPNQLKSFDPYIYENN